MNTADGQSAQGPSSVSRSGPITAVAALNFIYAGVCLLFGLWTLIGAAVFALFRSYTEASISLMDERSQSTVSDGGLFRLLGSLTLIVASLILAMAIPFLVAGFGVLAAGLGPGYCRSFSAQCREPWRWSRSPAVLGS